MSERGDWERFSTRRKVAAAMLSRTQEPILCRRPARSATIGAYQFSSYCGRYYDASEVGDDMKLRGVTITIKHAGRVAGIAKLKEWWLPPFSSPTQFWDTADNLSQEQADLAELVGSFWQWHEWPPEFGTIVLFSRLVIDSRLDSGRAALDRLGEYLMIEFGRRASVLLLKAFPLEFANALGPGHEHRRASFERRSRAMLRMYGASLRARPLPDQEAYAGWMWRSLRYCPDPSLTADPDWRERE